MIKHYNIKVSGIVQGVSYRFFTRLTAHELGISGFVKNEKDGSVYIECEGEEEKLKQFTDWCRHGPHTAEVRDIQIEEGGVVDFEDFDIRK